MGSTKTTSNMSKARQNFHEDCEAGLNQCINILLHSAYINKCLAAHFERDDVALPGFSKYFRKLSEEHQSQSNNMKSYQNKRGGRVLLQEISSPDPQTWKTGLEGM